MAVMKGIVFADDADVFQKNPLISKKYLSLLQIYYRIVMYVLILPQNAKNRNKFLQELNSP